MSTHVQLDCKTDGEALVDLGLLSSYNTVSGVALNTFGFVIAAQDIWAPDFGNFPVPKIVTTWVVEYLPS